MSSIDSLLIQGIRSFSPNRPSVINFYPITLILGPNGAGKTTIIECLRFIASGDVPPNTNRGKTWIHDPNLMKKNVSCVRAKIQLKFNDIYKKTPIATKNLELSVTRDKLGNIKTNIKTVDFAIKFDNQTRVSTKCAEIDSLMLDHLGVSKAILINVIFCHQDDSNWPLSEGKTLKEKFDQIFGSTEYVKSLKKLKDIHKEHLRKIELLQKDKIYLDEIINQHKKLKLSIKKKEEDLNEIRNSINEIKVELEPIENSLNKMNLNTQELSEISSRLDQIHGHINAENRAYESLKEKISDVFNGNLEELKQCIDDHKKNIQIKMKSKTKLDENSNNLEISLNDQIDKLQIEKHNKVKFEFNKKEYHQCEEQIKKYFDEITNSKILSEHTKLCVPCENLILDLDSIDKFLGQIKLEVENANSELNEKKKEMNFKIQVIQKEINENKNKEFKSKQIIQVNEEQITKSNKEIDNIGIQLDETKIAEKKILQLNDDLHEAIKSLESQNKLYDLKQLEDKINLKQNSINNIYKEINDLNNLSNDIHKYEEDKKKLKELEIEIEEKNSQLNTYFRLIKNTLLTFNIDKDVKKPIYSMVKKEIYLINSKIVEKTNDTQKKQNWLNEEKKDLDFNKKSIQDLKLKINQIETKLQKLCDGKTFDQQLEHFKKIREKLDEDLLLSSQSEYLLKCQLNNLKKNTNCTLCEKSFTSNEKKNLIDKVECKLKLLPNQTELLKKKRNEHDKLYEQLLSCKNDEKDLVSYYNNLKIKEDQMVVNNEKYLNLTKDLEHSTFELDKLKKNYDNLLAVEEDVLKYDECLRFIKEKNELKDQLLPQLNKKVSFETLDELNLMLINKNDEIQENQNKIKILEKKKINYTQLINKSKEKIIEIKQMKLNYENQQQQAFLNRENMKKLKETIENLHLLNKEEIKNLKFHQDLDKSLIKKKDELVEQQIQLNDYLEKKWKKMEKYQSDLESLFEKLKIIKNKYNPNLFDEINENINELELNILKIRESKNEIENKRIKLLDFLDKARLEERDLDDNLTLLSIENKINELKLELVENQKKLGAFNRTSILKLKDQYEKKSVKLNTKIQILNNDYAKIEQLLKEDFVEIKLEKYKNIEKKYKSSLINLEIEKMVCEDINKYHVALEKSVLTYHGTKMIEINQLVYKFWKKTYSGNDIDTVKIISEESINSIDKRKSYNYRVVMVKSGIEMDMRGRCSAGQRVLACLVIRLALAEIFCISCGILALDEPTTNLDKESIYSFANSLKELMAEHRKYKNFQIIVITHDEEFLKCLDNENDEYYKVIQDENGDSVIERHKLYERD